jgi:hypothetical protein
LTERETKPATWPVIGPMAEPSPRPAARLAAGRESRWWLISRVANGQTEVLTVRPNGGRWTLPVIGFREEAEMFLKLDGLGDGWRAKEDRGA